MLEKEVVFFDPWSAIVQTIFSCKSLDLAKAQYQSGFFWPGNLMLFVAERAGELSFVVLESMNSFIFVFEIGFNLQRVKKGHREKHYLTVPASYSRCHPSKRLPVKAVASQHCQDMKELPVHCHNLDGEVEMTADDTMEAEKINLFLSFSNKRRGLDCNWPKKKVFFSLYFQNQKCKKNVH